MTERELKRAAAIAVNEKLAGDMEKINEERRARGLVRMRAPKPGPVPRTLQAPSIARIHACISGALGDAVPDADISAVSKAMGHASIGVTSDIYGSLFEKASADMAKKASALIPRQGAEKVSP